MVHHCLGKKWGLSAKCNSLEVKRISLEGDHIPWGQMFWKVFPLPAFGIGFCKSTCKPLSSEGCVQREAALMLQMTAW